MVQRYDIAGKYMVYPKDEGRIVLYEDYAKLEAELREFAEQVMYEPCSKVTEEMACEILGI